MTVPLVWKEQVKRLSQDRWDGLRQPFTLYTDNAADGGGLFLAHPGVVTVYVHLTTFTLCEQDFPINN